MFIAYPCDSGSNLRIEENGFIHMDGICGIQIPAPFITFSNSLQVIFTATHKNTRKNAFYLKLKTSKWIFRKISK